MKQASPPGPDHAARDGSGEERPLPFGLGQAEIELLAQVLSEAAAPLGIDGAALVDGLAAGRSLGEALRLPPGLGDVLYANAHTWFAAGRPDRAEALFRALCVIQGGVADHWVGYGICLRVSDRTREASLAFATAVALRPDWAIARFHAADSAIAQADWAGGSGHLDAFEHHLGPDVPPNMRQEASRLRLAVAHHRGPRPPAPVRGSSAG